MLIFEKMKGFLSRTHKILAANPQQSIAQIRYQYRLFKTLEYYRKNKLINYRTYGLHYFTYLSQNLSFKQKLSILTHHYKFLRTCFNEDSLKRIFVDGLICWEKIVESNSFQITMKTSHFLEFEGSLSLHFIVNKIQIFSLSFSFAPGGIFNKNMEQTTLIVSALKGVKNEFKLISVATKTFSQITPQVVLMKVIESICLSLKINTALAVNANNQVCYATKNTDLDFYENYDKLWDNLRGEKQTSGYYRFRYPAIEKSILLTKQNHRNRTLRKRAVLQNICNESKLIIEGYLNHY